MTALAVIAGIPIDSIVPTNRVSGRPEGVTIGSTKQRQVAADFDVLRATEVRLGT